MAKFFIFISLIFVTLCLTADPLKYYSVNDDTSKSVLKKITDLKFSTADVEFFKKLPRDFTLIVYIKGESRFIASAVYSEIDSVFLKKIEVSIGQKIEILGNKSACYEVYVFPASVEIESKAKSCELLQEGVESGILMPDYNKKFKDGFENGLIDIRSEKEQFSFSIYLEDAGFSKKDVNFIQNVPFVEGFMVYLDKKKVRGVSHLDLEKNSFAEIKAFDKNVKIIDEYDKNVLLYFSYLIPDGGSTIEPTPICSH